MKKKAIFSLLVALIGYPSITEAQQKAYPHLQIFLVPSQPRERVPFITFWDASHKLAAGPFPIKLLERGGLSVSLQLFYSKTNEELPSEARLKVQRHDSTSLQNEAGPVLLDQADDFIADRGVSKMFPDGPFLVIGHKAPSKGILRLGKIMGEIQERLLTCDKDYRQELEMALNSLRGMSSYDHALKAVESTFPPCPLQTP